VAPPGPLSAAFINEPKNPTPNHTVGETTHATTVKKIDTIAAQKPDKLNFETLLTMLKKDKTIANGRYSTARLNIAQSANRQPKTPDNSPAVDMVLSRRFSLAESAAPQFGHAAA
jgi:hypothetical protein